MIVLHNETYNPKIDYLICKQLVKALPEDYDEDRIRSCYRDNSLATEPYEKDLVSIKTFFEQNDVLQFTNNIVENLYRLCTHENISFQNEDLDIVTQKDIRTIAAFVNEIDCQRNTLFQILFLLRYLAKNHSPIIPYTPLCNRLFYAISAREDCDAMTIFNKLQKRTGKYLKKHSIVDGESCVSLLCEFKDSFLTEIDAVKVGYYGSYARGDVNEYSDFDILAVFSDEKSLPLCKRTALEFWRSKLPIEVDIAVINQSNFDDLPIGIKRSIKFI